MRNCKNQKENREISMIFKRKIYQKLLEWKKESNGKTALLIKGARRIGKSTIAEEFAKNEYETYIVIDFAFAPQEIHELFKNMLDLDYFFLQLQLQYGVQLKERQSLIIFDEVQFNPLARQAIKRLVQDGRYDYIETGSLISISKNVNDILIPSEERKIEMFPLDFEEFLLAIGDKDLPTLLKMAYQKQVPLGDKQNRNIMRKFRLYMLVGGMPQAVLSYIESNNLKVVDDVKRDIINLYLNDFYKIDSSGKISDLFKAIPSELNKHSMSYQISSVLPNDRKHTVEEQLTELIASKTVLPAYNVHDPASDLSTMYSRKHFRLYLADTGLLVSLMFMNKDFTDNIIYNKLLNDKLPINLGSVYENVVAQILTANGNRLFYHTFANKKQKRNYEIDFFLSEKDKITPIEVKSSGYRAHKSIDLFTQKYSNRIARNVILYTKDFKREDTFFYLPVYMTQWL